MSSSLKTNRIVRNFFLTSRTYCEGKSIYQREEEGPKPRSVYGKPYPEWRRPWIKRDGEWTSKLAVFTEKNPSPHIMNSLQNLPNLSIDNIKEWWANMKIVQEIENQKFLPERVAALGSNLAALHFFAYRQALVRLKDSKDWIGGDITKLQLPDKYTDGYTVEAVDCTNFHHNGIRYEGLKNLAGLNFLKWLTLKNNKHVDDWCLDRIAGQNGQSLEYLDISGCNITAGCIYALARMSVLKYLIISDTGYDMHFQAALSILERDKPNLLIKVVNT